MIGIHPVHRRLAELYLVSKERKWTPIEVQELHHCIRVNAEIVMQLDGLKELAFLAHTIGDQEWELEICAEIDKLEAKMI